MIPFLVTNVINCVILANTIPYIVKYVTHLVSNKYNGDYVISYVSLANRMALM